MNKLEDATHYYDFYGNRHYFKVVTYQHMNQVSEEWENRNKVYFWDNNCWVEDKTVQRSLIKIRKDQHIQ